MSTTALYFEEIDGQRRKVRLEGSAAPIGGIRAGDPAFTLGGEVRGPKQYDPGRQAPNRHVTGTKENDLVVKVHLRDVLTGVSGQATRTRQLIDAIRLAARPLRIVWGKELRRGILQKTEFGVEGEGDYTGTLTFEVYDAGDSGFQRRTRRVALALPGTFDDVLDEFAARPAAMVAIPGFSFDVGTVLVELYAAATRPLAELLRLVDAVTQGAGDTLATFGALTQAAAALIARCADLAAYLGAYDDPIALDDALARARWARQRAEALAALGEVSKRAFDLGASAETRAKGTGRTGGRIYLSRAGDTVESIARLNGCSPEDVRGLNPALPLGILATGTTVVLP